MARGGCAASSSRRIHLAVQDHRLEMITGMRRVGQFAPLARARIERIQPGNVSARVTQLMARHQVNQPVVHDRSGPASEPIRRDGRPLLPAIGGRIGDVHVRQRGLTLPEPVSAPTM